MADNVAITAGSGTTIAADDVGGVLYQRNKLALGVDGSATDAVGGAGAVDAGTQRVTLASDDPAVTGIGSLTETAPATDTASSGLNGRLQRVAQRLTSLIALLPTSLGANGGLKIEGVSGGTGISVGSTRAKISPTITVTAATYSANQSVGGKLTLSSVNSASGGSGYIEHVTLQSASTTAITAAMRIFFYDADPSGSTFTDNGTFNTVAADSAKCIGFVDITDWNSAGTSSNVSIGKSGAVFMPYKPSGTSLYAAIQTLGTPVFSGTGVLSLNVSVVKD